MIGRPHKGPIQRYAADRLSRPLGATHWPSCSAALHGRLSHRQDHQLLRFEKRTGTPEEEGKGKGEAQPTVNQEAAGSILTRRAAVVSLQNVK